MAHVDQGRYRIVYHIDNPRRPGSLMQNSRVVYAMNVELAILQFRNRPGLEKQKIFAVWQDVTPTNVNEVNK